MLTRLRNTTVHIWKFDHCQGEVDIFCDVKDQDGEVLRSLGKGRCECNGCLTYKYELGHIFMH